MKTTTDGWWNYWNNVEIKHYLLLSGHHNESIGNNSFEAKRNTYTQLLQQQEIRNMTERDHLWDKAKIDKRKELIVYFVMATFYLIIKEELQELFGKPVDIVRLRKNMNPMLLKQIERDGIYA